MRPILQDPVNLLISLYLYLISAPWLCENGAAMECFVNEKVMTKKLTIHLNLPYLCAYFKTCRECIFFML